MSDATLPPILVVDDNHDNAEIIRQYLEIRGYPITVAHSGDEALALFEKVRVKGHAEAVEAALGEL